MSRRLHVKKLLSIGAVVDGDNPEAEADILFWKAAPDPLGAAPSNGAAGRGSIDSGPRPARRRSSPQAMAKAVRRRLDQLDAQTDQLTAETRSLAKAITAEEEARSMPRQARLADPDTVRGEVDRLAAEKIAKGLAKGYTDGRVQVWRERPDLVAASRAKGEQARRYAVNEHLRPAEPVGIAEQVVKAVDARADELAAVPYGMGKTPAERRVEIWKSPQGQKLRALYTAAYRKGAKGDQLAKSAEHSDAAAILKRWQADPAEGLR